MERSVRSRKEAASHMRHVTIKDIARIAGVSTSTVSRALSGSKELSEATRERIVKICNEQGYRVNALARSLIRSRTNVIGLIVPEVTNPFYAEVSLGIETHARQLGYNVMLCNSQQDTKTTEELFGFLTSHQVDGIILANSHSDAPRWIQQFAPHLPTVLLGIPENPMGLDEIDTDFERAAHELIDLFTEQHHQEIALLHTPEGTENGGSNFAVRFRQSVVREASDKGITLHVASPEDWDLAPSERLRSTLNRFPNITGLIIDDDNAVISAPQTFTELGMQVPEDLSVAVVVPDVIRDQMRIPYTAIDINLPAVAQEAVDTLVRRIDNPNAPSVTRLVSQPLIRQHSVKSL